jgi:peroxin-5
LWNRLGSSLSNGSKPEEALGAYREALQLRPTYTRAIYNVGVACACPANFLHLRPSSSFIIRSSGLNIGAHKEAAEHFLSALTMQEASGPETSEQLWFTLRRVFLAMVCLCDLVYVLPYFPDAFIFYLQERPDLADLAKLEARTSLETFRKEGFDF